METEQTLRRRIKTVSDLHSIVRTMKALSAVSARQYEAVVKSLIAYSQTIELGLQVVFRDRQVPKPAKQRLPERRAAIVFGSDVGLCGHFNEDLITLAADCMNDSAIPPANHSVLAIGARIEARLSELGLPVEETFMTPGSAAGIGTTVNKILDKIDDWQDEAIEQVVLVYSRACTPTSLNLLPVDIRQLIRSAQKPWPNRALPCFSMETEVLLAALIRQYLFVSLYRACAESLASEHLMRLKTTQAAEKNIQERHDELVAEFRSRRQDAIDAELLDIGAGFEAVSGNA